MPDPNNQLLYVGDTFRLANIPDTTRVAFLARIPPGTTFIYQFGSLTTSYSVVMDRPCAPHPFTRPDTGGHLAARNGFLTVQSLPPPWVSYPPSTLNSIRGACDICRWPRNLPYTVYEPCISGIQPLLRLCSDCYTEGLSSDPPTIYRDDSNGRTYYSPNYVRTCIDGLWVCPAAHRLYTRLDGTVTLASPISELEDDRDDPDEEPESDIGDYHSGSRPWLSRLTNIPDLALGTELEILAHAHSDRASIATLAGRFGFLAEEDGSLDRCRGIEIIGPPLLLDNYLSPTGDWQSFLNKARKLAHGWDAGPGYGMHVSINILRLEHPMVANLIGLVCNNPRTFNQLGGRTWNSYCAYPRKPKLPPGEHLSSYFVSSEEVREIKYEALSLRSRRRGELRIFRSTMRTISFLKNIEVAAALRAYCLEVGEGDVSPVGFVKFLTGGAFLNTSTWLDEKPGRRSALLASAEADTTNPCNNEFGRTLVTPVLHDCFASE